MSPGSGRIILTTFAATLTLGASSASGQASRGGAMESGSRAVPTIRGASPGRLPLAFEQNTGRYDKRVKFLTRMGHATVFLTRNEMVLVMPGKTGGERQEAGGKGLGLGAIGGSSLSPHAVGGDPPVAALDRCLRGNDGGGVGGSRGSGGGRSISPLASHLSPVHHVLRMKLVGASGKSVAMGLERQPGIVNYLIGNDPRKWRTRVPTYARAKLAGVYPGIDLVYYGVSGERREASGRAVATRHSPLATHLEYDFIVKPGADPERIRLAFEGAERVRVAGGELILTTPAGDVRLTRPYAYQDIGGKRRQVACDYRLIGRGAALRLARYDRSRTLVVDPNLGCSTYFGGSGDDGATGVAIGPSGDIYVTGSTLSTDFPATGGAYATYNSGDTDVFVARLSQDARLVRWCTYIGGERHDHGHGIGVGGDATVTVAGDAWSSDFPTTVGAFQFSHGGGTSDAFALRLGVNGDALVWSTYLGGSSNETGSGMELLGDGSVIVTGETESANFPTSAGAFDRTYGGNWDAYVTALDAAGRALLFSTYLGGGDSDEGLAIAAVDTAIYVCGRTLSSDFPATPGAFDTSYSAWNDAFVAKLSTDGSAVVACSYLGGAGEDIAWDIQTDAAGYVYVAGETSSADFPTTVGAWDRTLGARDAFVTKLTPDLGQPIYSTFVGGSLGDTAYGLVVGPYGNATVVGFAHSTNFPVTADAIDSTYGGNGDGFLAKLTASGGGLVFSTYLGGANNEHVHDAALADDGDVYIAGHSRSTDFPTSTTAYDRSFNGGASDGDAFVAGVMFTTQPTTIVAAAASGRIGESVSLSATLTRTAGGALAGRIVRFFLYATDLGTAATNASGVATRAYRIPDTWGVGPKTLTARFDGDDPYTPCSDTNTLTIARGDTVLVASPAAGLSGSAVTLEAALTRVGDGSALGSRTVGFFVEGSRVGDDVTDASGAASVAYVVPAGDGPGAVPFTAEFAGDAAYNPSSDGDHIAVSVATALAASDVSGSIGQTVSLSAAIARTDNGAPVSARLVSFHVEGSPVGSSNTDAGGTAVVVYVIPEALGPGAWEWGASFAESDGYLASGDTAGLDVGAADTSLWAADRTGTITETVTLRQYDLKRTTDNALLAGKAITYKVDGSEVGTSATDAGGDSLLGWIIPSGPATRTITVEFAGDAGYNPTSDDATLTCQSWTTKMASFDRTVRLSDRTELKARLLRGDNVPLYGKGISFYVDGTFIVTRNTGVDGYAKWPVYDVPDGAGAGARTILSEWPGNGGYSAISKTATLTVLKAIPYIWVLPKTVPQGAIANLYAYFRRLYDYQKQVGKTVDFKIDGTVVQTVVTDANGVARYLYTTTEPPGVYTIRCEFSGDAWLDAGYGEGSLTIY